VLAAGYRLARLTMEARMLRLVQIEILGFKSFPHKTVVELDGGINCVVGPNGSGKSNIADAIAFAFGTQSGHELRTNKLANLIFAGTEQLRPLNMAAVTLHFERLPDKQTVEDDGLPSLDTLSLDESDLAELDTASLPAGSQLTGAGGYSGRNLTRHIAPGAAEQADRTPSIIKELETLRPGERVSVTRRVFRDGSGGYFINGEAVRLKDVDQFFARYNLGRNAVLSVNQGEVEKKILETPQEIREWLAGATGVSLLLVHKARAQQKLKRTHQNLERLEDIRSSERELVADLAGQRVKAEEHLRLQNQLRAVELNEIRREVEFAQRQQESAAAALKELAGALTASRQQLDVQRKAIEAANATREQSAQQLDTAERSLAKAQQDAARCTQDAAVARRAAQAAQAAREQALADQAEAGQQLEVRAADLAANAAELAQAREQVQAAGTDRELSQLAVRDAQLALQAVTAQQSELANQSFELAQQLTRCKNEISANERAAEQLSGQLASRQRHLDAIKERLEQQEGDLKSEQASAEALALSEGELGDKLAACQDSLQQLAGELNTTTDALGKLRHDLAGITSRQRTLSEITSRDDKSGEAYLLYESGAASLAQASAVEFAPEWRPAFTRLLAHLDTALVGDRAQFGALLDALRGKQLDALVLHPAVEAALHPQSVWRHLRAVDSVRYALISTVGEVLAAESLDEAQALLASEAQAAAVVLRDGSAVVGRGWARLGPPPPERAVRVARQSDIAELQRQANALGEQIAVAEKVQADLKQRQASLQWERDETSAKLAAAKERLRNALALCDRLHKQVHERRTELELLTHQAGELETERERIGANTPQLAEQAVMLEERQQELRAQQAERGAQRAEAEAKLEAARAEAARIQTQVQLAQQAANHLEQAGFDLAERQANLRQRLKNLTERAAVLEKEATDSAAAAVEFEQRAQELAAQQAGLGGQVAQLKERRGALDIEAEAARQQLSQFATEAARLEQEEVSLAAQRERAVERTAEWLDTLRERFHMTLSQLIADPAVTAPPPEAQFDAQEAGRGKLREEKARLSGLLDELGPVNLLAIDQHQQHSQRLEFMDTQASELEQAIADLSRLVEDLDQATEVRYRASLRKIEARFNELYHHLFGGGWARLRFEQPEAIIDSGVEVEVQLPGGRRHSLRSLSGGQRSLIFLALFFAVHSVRSPGFCILDEADAALDDANVEQFAKLIQQAASGEQFIVVTHNKKTMEIADKLIGVVGRPKGVSNLLEVDLREARKLAGKTVA
jgi:chromosome segregation protein